MNKLCLLFATVFCCVFASAATWSFVEGSTTQITDGNFVLNISTDSSTGETTITGSDGIGVAEAVLDLRGVEALGLNVTTTGGHSLRYTTNITGFIGHEDLVNIGEYTFCSLSKLTEATFYGDIETINDNAFESCGALTKVTFTSVEKIKRIPSNCFAKCYAFKTISPMVFPNVTYIGASAFIKCPLTEMSLEFPEVVDMGNHAFNGCDAYKVTINKLVKGSGQYFFCDSSVKHVEMRSLIDIPEQFCKSNSKLESVIISPAVTNIGANAFANCSSLSKMEPMKFNCVQNIGGMAFHRPIFSGVLDFSRSTFTTLPSHALRTMPNLSDIILPETLTEIATYNFVGVRSHNVITFLGDRPKTTGNSIFGENSGNRATIRIRPKYEKSWIEGGAVSPIENHPDLKSNSAYPGDVYTIGVLDTTNDPNFAYPHWVIRVFDPPTVIRIK